MSNTDQETRKAARQLQPPSAAVVPPTQHQTVPAKYAEEIRRMVEVIRREATENSANISFVRMELDDVKKENAQLREEIARLKAAKPK